MEEIEVFNCGTSVPSKDGNPYCAIPQLLVERWNYKTNEVLGSGSFGVVISATDSIDHGIYAIKVIPNRNFLFGDMADILRELIIHGKLDHPNVVKYKSSGTFSLSTDKLKELIQWYCTDKIENYSRNVFGYCFDWATSNKIPVSGYYIKMEFCGETLRKWLNKHLKEGDKPDTFTCKEIAQGIADGLHYIHKKGIIHRDLRPENILFSKMNFVAPVKIGDFGLSISSKIYKDQTMTLSVWDLRYRAPEMEDEHKDGKAKYGQLADLFSFGLILSEIFDPTSEIKLSKKFEEIKYYKNTGNNVQKISWLNSLILQLTERQPTKRITSYGDFQKEMPLKLKFHMQDYNLRAAKENEENLTEIQKIIENAVNKVLKTHNDDMEMILRGTVSEKQIELQHKLIKEEALVNFEGLIPKIYRPIVDLGHQIIALKRKIDKNFTKLKMNWETKNRERITAQWDIGLPTAKEEYRKRIKEIIGCRSFLEPNNLLEFHERIQNILLDKYCSIFEYENFTEEFQTQLRNDLRKIFMDFDKANTAKMIEAIEGKLGKALAIAVSNYQQQLENIERDVELSEDGFRQKSDQEKENIRFQFIAAIQQEPYHIQNEFLGKLNLEFELQSKIALEKFQSAALKYANIIEMKKNEIEADVDQVLKKHTNSSEIFIVGKTEELGENLIEQSMIKLSSLKKDSNVPSAMLAAGQSKTIEQIKNKIKAVKEKTDEKMTEYKHEVNDFVHIGFVYYKSIMDNLDDIDSEELLEEKHSNSLKGCVQELKNKSLIKDEKWLQPFIRKLEENIYTYYNSNVKKVFIYEFSQHNMILSSAKIEATKMYREEMEDYFKKTPFTKPIDLQAYNSKLCAKISKEVTAKLKLKKEQSAKLIQFLAIDFETYQNKNTMNTPTGDPAIGIDLGTTYTCVAIYENGETRVIPNERGRFTFPSYVAFTPTGEFIGHPAKEMAHAYPQKTIYDAKRLIGRRFDEETVQRDIKNWPFEVVNDENAPKIKVQTKDGEKIFPPEQILAKILYHVKVIAERHLGKTIKKAVITVPAYFNDGQRQATKDAGEIAGLEVLQIINEPTAAAMAYHLSTKGVRQERNILVYDLGGGTFDVAVLNMKPGGHIVVKSVNGDTHLGGEDFDDNLLNEMIKRHKKKNGVDVSAGKNSLNVVEKAATARILRRLRNACEAAKINVSGGNNTTAEVIVDALVGVQDFLETITRKEFEDLNMDLFLKTLDMVAKSLEYAHIEKEDVHDIVLVGGSTRIPKVQEMLSEYFDGIFLQASINPDEVVACGAAIQAAILNGCQEQILKNISLKDVTPLSLGVELFDHSFSTIIKRNSPLPAIGTEDYQTVNDYQVQVAIVIYEGEEKLTRDNHLLGKFILKGIPKANRGKEKIIVNMKVNKEGILTVTAVCKSTGAQNNITIEDNRGRLTKEEKRRLKAVSHFILRDK